MASRRLFFDDLSKSEDDSQQGSSSERGVDLNVEIATASGRGSEACKSVHHCPISALTRTFRDDGFFMSLPLRLVLDSQCPSL